MEAEQHKDLIVAAAFDQTVHFFIEIAEVHNPDRGVILDEIGNESIGITVFDDEDTACAVALQNRITVVAAQECLIFVPCFKIGGVVQRAGFAAFAAVCVGRVDSQLVGQIVIRDGICLLYTSDAADE